LGVDERRLFVCSLNLAPGDPAGSFLRHLILKYVNGPDFRPKVRIGLQQLCDISAHSRTEQLPESDYAFDNLEQGNEPRGSVKSKMRK